MLRFLSTIIKKNTNFFSPKYSFFKQNNNFMNPQLMNPQYSFATVKRMDTHGNTFTVCKDISLEKAQEMVKDFEERGHKQTYWAVNDTDHDPVDTRNLQQESSHLSSENTHSTRKKDYGK